MKRALANLSDVCELIVDCEHKTAPSQEIGYPSIRTPNVGRGRLILDEVKRVSEKTYQAWTRRAVPQAGDLVLAREAPAGNVAIIPKNVKVCLGQRTVLIRPDRSKVDPHYLLYLLLESKTQARLLSYGSGATVAHINMSDIRTLPLPELPSLPTQRKVGAILSAYDELFEKNLRRIKVLEEMAQTIYREWFVHYRFPGHEKVKMVESPLGKIPEGWKVVRLGDVIELAYGKALKAEDRKGGSVPVYGSSGIVGFHNTALVKGPGIIVGRKGNIGMVYWSTRDFFPIDTVFYVRTRLPLHYVFYNLRTQNFISKDTAVPGVNRNQAYSLPFFLPSACIMDQFVTLVMDFFEAMENLRLRNDNVRRTRGLLLPKLMSGEIDVDALDLDGGNVPS